MEVNLAQVEGTNRSLEKAKLMIKLVHVHVHACVYSLTICTSYDVHLVSGRETGKHMGAFPCSKIAEIFRSEDLICLVVFATKLDHFAM